MVLGGIHWIMAFLSTSVAKCVDNNFFAIAIIVPIVIILLSIRDDVGFDNGKVALTNSTSFPKRADSVLATSLGTVLLNMKLSVNKPLLIFKKTCPIKYLVDVYPGKFPGKNSLIGSPGEIY